MEEYEEELDDDIVSEVAEYSNKSDFSKGELSKIACQKCIELRKEEMKPGYYNFIMKGETINRVWIPDARQRYIGSVKAMMYLLNPEIKRDTEKHKREKFWDMIEKKMKEAEEHYIYTSYKEIRTPTGLSKWERTNLKYMPQLDSAVVVVTTDSKGTQRAEEVIGGWNKNINAYTDLMINIHDEIFAELNSMMDRLNYFKQKARF